jgi:hypothetical protein
VSCLPIYRGAITRTSAFLGGAVGYFGYDPGRLLESPPATNPADESLLELDVGFDDWVLAGDHFSGAGWLMATGLPAGREATHAPGSRRSSAPNSNNPQGTPKATVTLAVAGYEAHGPLAGSLVLGLDTAHGTGNGHAARLLDPPDRHTEVVGVHDYDGAPSFQPFVKGVGDLSRKALLNLRAAGVTLHQPGELGQTYDLTVRYVADVGFTDQGQEMTLTRREEGYIADKDHLVVVLLKLYVQLQGGIHSQSGEEKSVSLGHPPGRTPQSFPVRIFPYGA